MNNIEMIRGDTQVFNIEINDLTGKPYILQAGDKLVFTLKKSVYHKDILLQKTIDTSMSLIIEHTDTMILDYGEYKYDIQLTQADGTVTTVIPPSSFLIKEEVNYD